jgi:hypothetical protein
MAWAIERYVKKNLDKIADKLESKIKKSKA